MNGAKRNHPFSHYLRRFMEGAAQVEARMVSYDRGELTEAQVERMMRDEARSRERDRQAPGGGT